MYLKTNQFDIQQFAYLRGMKHIWKENALDTRLLGAELLMAMHGAKLD